MAHWTFTQERAGQERNPSTVVLNPSSSSRWDRRASTCGSLNEAYREGRIEEGENGAGEARGSLFLREKEGSERTSPVDSLLFCQTSDAPAP